MDDSIKILIHLIVKKHHIFEMDNSSNDSSFWSLIVKPGKESIVFFPDTSILTITTACIPIYPESSIGKPVRLIASIRTLNGVNDDIDQSPDDVKETNVEVLLASFKPGSIENASLNINLSPLNTMKLKVQGNAEIHLSGYLSSIEDNDEEEEFFEEEEISDSKIETSKVDGIQKIISQLKGDEKKDLPKNTLSSNQTASDIQSRLKELSKKAINSKK